MSTFFCLVPTSALLQVTLKIIWLKPTYCQWTCVTWSPKLLPWFIAWTQTVINLEYLWRFKWTVFSLLVGISLWELTSVDDFSSDNVAEGSKNVVEGSRNVVEKSHDCHSGRMSYVWRYRWKLRLLCLNGHNKISILETIFSFEGVWRVRLWAGKIWVPMIVYFTILQECRLVEQLYWYLPIWRLISCFFSLHIYIFFKFFSGKNLTIKIPF